MPSTSGPTLRPRQPLAPLPLSHYTHSTNTFPSPISLPLKRNAPSTLGSSSTSTLDSPKCRKVSHTDAEGIETIKRTRVRTVTPKARALLEKDELGVGKSPARRLFTDGSTGQRWVFILKGLRAGLTSSFGIVGAVPPSPTSIPGRSLAPSPPISAESVLPPTSPILNTEILENEQDVHAVGFTIYTDDAPLVVGLLTPVSKRLHTYNPPLAHDAIDHIPSSPASSIRSYHSQYDEDQENIPPALSYSASSTPSKRSSTTFSPSSKRSLSVEEDWTSNSGSRHRRTIERSKLGLESVIGHQEEEEEEELTPGRRILRRVDVQSAKGKMSREVNRI